MPSDQLQRLREQVQWLSARVGRDAGTKAAILGAVDGFDDDAELGRFVRTLRPRLLPFDELPQR